MFFARILPVSFFQWCETSHIGAGIRRSVWQFQVIETIHIMGLTVLLASVIIVDLRLLGMVLRRHRIAEVARDFMVWFWSALAITVCTGVALFLSEATRMSYNSAFFAKIALIVLAVSFHLTVHRKAIGPRAGEKPTGKLLASLSVLCWLSVALAGRAIAFVVGGF
jgi:hypothetical protein